MMAVSFEEVKNHQFPEDDIEKFNPYHGPDGRFTTGASATSFTYKPGQGKMYDNAIRNEKKRTEDNFDPLTELMTPNWFYEKPKPATTKISNPVLNDDGTPKGQVKGSNIMESFEMDERRWYESGYAVTYADQIAEAQGYKGKPAVVPKDVFDEAVKKTGIIAYRTMNEGNDVIDGKDMREIDFANELMYGDENHFALNGNGQTAYGGGIYMAANKITETKEGTVPDGFHARNDSIGYGYSDNPAVVTMTLSPTARIADYNDIRSRFRELSYDEKMNVGDEGAYAAALGYDGFRVRSAGIDCDYLVITNRTALIICDTVEDINGGKWEE